MSLPRLINMKAGLTTWHRMFKDSFIVKFVVPAYVDLQAWANSRLFLWVLPVLFAELCCLKVFVPEMLLGRLRTEQDEGDSRLQASISVCRFKVSSPWLMGSSISVLPVKANAVRTKMNGIRYLSVFLTILNAWQFQSKDNVFQRDDGSDIVKLR